MHRVGFLAVGRTLMVYHVVVDVVLHRHRGIVVETCWVAFGIGAEAAASFLWYVLLQFGSVRSVGRSVGRWGSLRH